MTRANRSRPDPGPRPSTMLVVRGGHSCAAAGVASEVAKAAAIKSRGSPTTRICSTFTDLGMHVLGEPIGRQLMAQAALPRFAVNHGARGRELIAESDIVD